jgi:murein DD-endopeptidase MepM/ murein hydrolase activator NlpD
MVLLFAVVIIVIAAASAYTAVYYRALEAEVLKRRNVELEREFAKLEEIKRHLALAELNSEKLRVMLGIEKTPAPAEPSISDIDANYTDKINIFVEKDLNVPSLVPTMGKISRSFGPTHTAIDIAAPHFSPVVAAASGIVTAAGWDSIYGNYIIIEHSKNYSTFYGHLSSINVNKGNKVAGGEIIGTVGSSGKSTSPHLHYEVRFRDKPVDPMGYFPFLFTYKE